jgi:hypothetical protein
VIKASCRRPGRRGESSATLISSWPNERKTSELTLLRKMTSKSCVKQQLAAVRMLFDRLITGQVVPATPAGAVRGPKACREKLGKTPVLDAAEWRDLLDSIPILYDHSKHRLTQSEVEKNSPLIVALDATEPVLPRIHCLACGARRITYRDQVEAAERMRM